MALLSKYKWHVILLTLVWALALISNHFVHHSFDYVRVVMRVVTGTTIEIDDRVVEIPMECYLTSEPRDHTRYPLNCKNKSKTFLTLSVRDVTVENSKNLRKNLTDYPHADIRDEFIYFAWGRPGEEFVGVIDHYLILPSMQLSVSGDDRDLVLRLARDISDHKIEIDPIDFGL